MCKMPVRKEEFFPDRHGKMGRIAAVLDTLREEKLNVVDFLHILLPHLVFRQIICSGFDIMSTRSRG